MNYIKISRKYCYTPMLKCYHVKGKTVKGLKAEYNLEKKR